MKCLRCGKDVNEKQNICENCGYDLNLQKNKRVVQIESDPEVVENQKITLIDNPILSFVLGLIALLDSMLIALGPKPVPFLYIILFIVLFIGSFYCSLKPCKVRLKPVREFGVFLSFIALALTIYGVVSWLLQISK